jgi:hypothetical protein
MSSSNSRLLSLFARFVSTPSDWSAVIQRHRLTTLLTSTNLLFAYRSEPILKEGIDSLSSQQSSFQDGWSLLGARLPNLMEYCGVVATLFPGTSTVESDFSVLRWEKDRFRNGLSDFGLEGVLQAKQFLFIEQFEQ